MTHDLLPDERQKHIRRLLADNGRVIAADLAREFATSEDTIRRDLRDLAAAGLCRRVYGGALAPSDAETTLGERMKTRPERKQALAAAAVAAIGPGMTLFIDAGSTNVAIARALPVGLALTLVTNAPVLAAALIDRSDLSIVIIGGTLDSRSGAVVGSKAIAELATMHFDLAILGSCGLDFDDGISATGFEEAELKRVAAGRARQVVAAIGNDKIGAPAAFKVIALSASTRLVFEHDAGREIAEVLGARGIPHSFAGPAAASS